MSPLTINIMLACYCSNSPEKHFPPIVWESDAARDSRVMLIENGLLFGNNQVTAKGTAWAKFICATPLPEQNWALPERETGEPV